jgi:hypothetical protein
MRKSNLSLFTLHDWILKTISPPRNTVVVYVMLVRVLKRKVTT